jgi:hypothetical protein
MQNGAELRQLERNIIASFEKIPFAYDPVEWIHSAEFRQFLDAWRDFAGYYSVHQADDAVKTIDTLVVRTYARVARLLHKLIDIGYEHRLTAPENAAAEGWHDEAQRALTILDGYLDDVTSAAHNRIVSEKRVAKTDDERPA